MNNKGLFSSKKFKYGSAATALTVLTVALIVLANVIFSALSSKFLWYADMTKSEIYTLSDATIEYLSGVDSEINIYFACEPDELSEGTYSEYTKYVYQTALLLADRFDNINVECHDVIREYDFFKPYRDTAASAIATTSVIIESGTEFRLYNLDAFFIFDENYENIWAYNGENKMVSGILQVTSSDMPVVCFTSEHGEKSIENEQISQIFTDAGFEVRTIDLSREDIPEDCRIVISYGPVYDFIGREAESGQANEISKLDSFLDNYGCFLIFADYENAVKLSNLNEFLEEWGIRFDTGLYVRDYDHSTSVDGITVVSEYVKDEDAALGASLYSDIASLDTMPKTVCRYGMPINILWSEGGGLTGTRQVFPVLKTYDTADTIKGGEVTATGQRNLMTLSRDKVIIDNQYYFSYVLACGTTDFASSENLISDAYANSDILYSAIRALGKERILSDIPYKAFDKTEVTITTSQANSWTVAMTAVLPVIVAAAGIVVYIRRKNS